MMLPAIFGGFAGVIVSAGTPLPVFYTFNVSIVG
jgi:hypothetical protein